MSQIEVSQLAVANEDWENFLSSLERLMAVHKKTLERLREVKSRNKRLRAELKSAAQQPALTQPTKDKRASTNTDGANICGNCGNEAEILASFCDRCGAAMLRCKCGRELSRIDKFCDRCGQPVQSCGA
jgi:hypothetical protein